MTNKTCDSQNLHSHLINDHSHGQQTFTIEGGDIGELIIILLKNSGLYISHECFFRHSKFTDVHGDDSMYLRITINNFTTLQQPTNQQAKK